MQKPWRLVLGQINPVVGAMQANAQQILQVVQQAEAVGADLVVFPELVLTGYPPEDLLLRPALERRVQQALTELEAALSVPVVLGYPGVREGRLYNLAALLRPGQPRLEYRKRRLPNYQVFDEKRYFHAGTEAVVFEHCGVSVGLLICEDVWHNETVEQTLAAGATLLLCLNASPYHQGKLQERLQLLRKHQHQTPLVYVNLVGGQDELVFDGASFILGAEGQLIQQGRAFEEQMLVQDFLGAQPSGPALGDPEVDIEASLYQALVLAVRDYVNKNHFPGVLLGLSGGIDSALTLCIAVDALGAERVTAVMMPYHYTAPMSEEDATEQARRLGVRYHRVPVVSPVSAMWDCLQPLLQGTAGTTLENLQARMRGTLLMALSNASGALVLTTGNKSEMSVGYATLYGDMAGGFDVLKDVYKMQVFRLAQWRNAVTPENPPIPVRVIERPPSAELAPGQVDQDTLPPYAQLDAILQRYVEEDWSADALVRAGFAQAVVYKVVALVDRNEYKRRQAALGPRLSQRGFGKDRRYPVTHAWAPGS